MISDEVDAPTEAQNTWVRAVNSDELSAHRPLKVAPWGQVIVLYRKLDGAPVALADSCPHRWAPLSDGQVEGDNIVCPYHGFKFCPRGHLVNASGKSSPPGVPSAKVFPVVERAESIWIWSGRGDPQPWTTVTT